MRDAIIPNRMMTARELPKGSRAKLLSGPLECSPARSSPGVAVEETGSGESVEIIEVFAGVLYAE